MKAQRSAGLFLLGEIAYSFDGNPDSQMAVRQALYSLYVIFLQFHIRSINSTADFWLCTICGSPVPILMTIPCARPSLFFGGIFRYIPFPRSISLCHSIEGLVVAAATLVFCVIVFNLKGSGSIVQEYRYIVNRNQKVRIFRTFDYFVL